MGVKKGDKRGNYVTTRAERAIAIMQENGGVVSAAMLKAGFSEEYSRQPQKFIATQTFQQLANIMLPDINLLEKHTEMLNSSKLETMEFPIAVSDAEIMSMLAQIDCIVQKIFKESPESNTRKVYFIASDNKSRMDAIDLAYKIKGHIKPGGPTPGVAVQVNMGMVREKYKK